MHVTVTVCGCTYSELLELFIATDRVGWYVLPTKHLYNNEQYELTAWFYL